MAKTSAADCSANKFIYRFIDSANTIEFGYDISPLLIPMYADYIHSGYFMNIFKISVVI